MKWEVGEGGLYPSAMQGLRHFDYYYYYYVNLSSCNAGRNLEGVESVFEVDTLVNVKNKFIWTDFICTTLMQQKWWMSNLGKLVLNEHTHKNCKYLASRGLKLKYMEIL